MEKAKSEWKEPKVSIWYYVGTKSGYHHFLHQDLGEKTIYRISDKELKTDLTFPLTKDRDAWKVMPWGVHRPKTIESFKGKNITKPLEQTA